MVYQEKLRKDFARCKTAKQVEDKLAEYENWNDYLDFGMTVGFGIGTLGMFALMYFTGNYIQHLDKLGHAGKGFIASRATGKVFDGIYRWFHKIEDADDDVRANLKPFVPRVAAEGASTALSAYGWEVAQRDISAFPGSVYDLDDMAADTSGHVLGSVIEYVLAWRRKQQYDAADKRLQQLGEKPLPHVWKVGFGGVSPKTS